MDPGGQNLKTSLFSCAACSLTCFLLILMLLIYNTGKQNRNYSAITNFVQGLFIIINNNNISGRQIGHAVLKCDGLNVLKLLKHALIIW